MKADKFNELMQANIDILKTKVIKSASITSDSSTIQMNESCWFLTKSELISILKECHELAYEGGFQNCEDLKLPYEETKDNHFNDYILQTFN